MLCDEGLEYKRDSKVDPTKEQVLQSQKRHDRC